MPKSPALEPKSLPDGRWLLDVSAKASPTGKRQRLFFSNESKAKTEASRIKGELRKWGETSRRLTAGEAEDAAKAYDILNGRCTLSEAAQHWSDWKERTDRSVTLEALWNEYQERKETSVSDSYLKDMSRYSVPLIAALGQRTVSEIEPIEIEKAIEGSFHTDRQFDNASRTIRPAFSFAIKRGYLDENPFTRIESRKPKKSPTEIATLEECEAVLEACRDHRKEKNIPMSYRLDCSDCIPAVALQLFAGIRPKEITRLHWEHVDFDHEFIKVGLDVAKTRSVRNIEMATNLRAWLELTPEGERTGRIIPSVWGDKIKAIRHVVGIAKKQDVLRHSFASYHLAAYGDIKKLQEAMGHGTPEMVLQHYRALVKKADGVKFWRIAPKGAQLVEDVA